MSFTSFLLQTSGAAGNPEGAMGGGLGMLIPLILIVLIMYIFMIRPQNKKQKETQKMLDALKKGDKVITIGGIHGTVSQVKEQTVVVKVDDGAKIEFNRTAISTVVTDKPATAEKEEKKGFFGFGKKKAKDAIKDKDEKAAASDENKTDNVKEFVAETSESGDK